LPHPGLIEGEDHQNVQVGGPFESEADKLDVAVAEAGILKEGPAAPVGKQGDQFACGCDQDSLIGHLVCHSNSAAFEGLCERLDLAAEDLLRRSVLFVRCGLSLTGTLSCGLRGGRLCPRDGSR
jgi:hypothetical protein